MSGLSSRRPKCGDVVITLFGDKGWWPYQRSPWGQRVTTISPLSSGTKGGDLVHVLLEARGLEVPVRPVLGIKGQMTLSPVLSFRPKVERPCHCFL